MEVEYKKETVGAGSLARKNTQNQVGAKLVAFKTEVTRDLPALEALCFTLKEQGGDKALAEGHCSDPEEREWNLVSLKKCQAKKGAKDYLVDTLAKACTYRKGLKSLKVRTKKALKVSYLHNRTWWHIAAGWQEADKNEKPFYCTGLHMGWIAFLLPRFAHGLDSLFIAPVCTWAG